MKRVPDGAVAQEFLKWRFPEEDALYILLRASPPAYGTAYRNILAIRSIRAVFDTLHLSTESADTTSTTVAFRERSVRVSVDDVCRWCGLYAYPSYRNIRTKVRMYVSMHQQLSVDQGTRFDADTQAGHLLRQLSTLLAPTPRLPPQVQGAQTAGDATWYEVARASSCTAGQIERAIANVRAELGYIGDVLPRTLAY